MDSSVQDLVLTDLDIHLEYDIYRDADVLMMRGRDGQSKYVADITWREIKDGEAFECKPVVVGSEARIRERIVKRLSGNDFTQKLNFASALLEDLGMHRASTVVAP